MAEAEITQEGARRSRGPGMFVAFKPGQAIMVQVPTDSQRYWGRIIGSDPYDCFIVKLPMVPGILRIASVGASLTLRMENDGELYGFTCDVISAVFKPSPFLILSYPSTAERLQLRRHKRVKCLIPSVLTNTYFTSQAFMVDISRGGCRLLLDPFLKQKAISLMPGDEADLSISLDAMNPLSVHTEVVTLQDQGQARFVSARFQVDDDENSNALTEFMTRLELIENIVDQNCKG